jgi:hypothetical protein
MIHNLLSPNHYTLLALLRTSIRLPNIVKDALCVFRSLEAKSEAVSPNAPLQAPFEYALADQ